MCESYVSCSVSECMCVSVTALTATYLVYMSKVWQYYYIQFLVGF